MTGVQTSSSGVNSTAGVLGAYSHKRRSRDQVKIHDLAFQQFVGVAVACAYGDTSTSRVGLGTVAVTKRLTHARYSSQESRGSVRHGMRVQRG